MQVCSDKSIIFSLPNTEQSMSDYKLGKLISLKESLMWNNEQQEKGIIRQKSSIINFMEREDKGKFPTVAFSSERIIVHPYRLRIHTGLT